MENRRRRGEGDKMATERSGSPDTEELRGVLQPRSAPMCPPRAILTCFIASTASARKRTGTRPMPTDSSASSTPRPTKGMVVFARSGRLVACQSRLQKRRSSSDRKKTSVLVLHVQILLPLPLCLHGTSNSKIQAKTDEKRRFWKNFEEERAWKMKLYRHIWRKRKISACDPERWPHIDAAYGSCRAQLQAVPVEGNERGWKARGSVRISKVVAKSAGVKGTNSSGTI